MILILYTLNIKGNIKATTIADTLNKSACAECPLEVCNKADEYTFKSVSYKTHNYFRTKTIIGVLFAIC